MSSSSDNNAVRAEKQALRKLIRSKMKEETKDIVGESLKVWERLFELDCYQQADKVSMFLSMPSGEINTDAALENAILAKKAVYVPEVGANFEQADMEMILCPDGVPDFHKTWPTNKWKIPEPPKDYTRILAKPGDLDVIIVPGLAFDENGGRLGQGKGYFDRFIARMRQSTTDDSADTTATINKPVLVAVCLQPQLIDGTIPMTEHDFPMDIILTPERTIVVHRQQQH